MCVCVCVRVCVCLLNHSASGMIWQKAYTWFWYQFPFSNPDDPTKVTEPNLPSYLPIVEGDKRWFHYFSQRHKLEVKRKNHFQYLNSGR